jgi:outer membrane protein TolC
VGLAPGALDGALAAERPVPRPPEALALDIPADTLRQRHDVRQAEQRIAAALARVSQADAARYPSLRLSGSLGLRALTLGALGDGAAATQALLASVSAPLFDGGAARAQVRVQEAALEQARVNYQATVLAALQEVEDALVALQGERVRLEHLQVAAQAAGNAALLAQNRFESGLIDFQSVLETQRTQLSTQDAVAVSAANVGAGHVRLFKALGGGWQ